MALTVRCRGPSGQATLAGLDANLRLADFQQRIADATGVPPAQQELLAGFPPRPLALPADADATLASLALASGDSLVVRVRAPGAAPSAAAAGPVAAPGAPAAAGSAPQARAQQPGVAVPQPVPAKKAASGQPAASATQHRAAPAATAQAAASAPQQPARASNGAPSSAPSALAELSEDEQLARAIAASLGEDVPEPAYWSAPKPAAVQTAAPSAAQQSKRASPEARLQSVTMPDGSCLVRRVMADDNSCLFSAVGYVTQQDRSQAAALRAVIANAVAADPFTYNDGFLGRPNAEYCKWILDPKRWGGAIELSILSRHFEREIAAYDVQTQRCDVYGQGAGYSTRVMVIYNGLHYDALALSAYAGAPEDIDETVVDTTLPHAAQVDRAAAQLVRQCHEARQFTNTATFTLRCGVCGVGVRGEREAVEHATATGHAAFSEYH